MRIEESHFKKFVGVWNTDGLLLKTDKNPEMKIKGTDTYELILDGFFILHKADVLMGEDNSKTYEIIVFGENENSFTMHHYENSGSSGVISATVENGKWTFQSPELRFTGKFSNNDNVFSGTWQQRTDNKEWVDFIEITLSKYKV